MTRLRAPILAFVTLVAIGCAPRPDPRVQAAQDFKSTVFDLIGQDEAQSRRLNALRLGMSDQEVLQAAGAPERRETGTTDTGQSRETWVYNGQLSILGTLTFENGRLVQIQTN
ncbi:MAG TPA: DUF2845 domain-containing protein [Candidatus Binatia bacterium]|nr:DUF2845 domain-containing protein [Candidatus Binatia bacterium]